MSIVSSNQWGQIKEEINNNALPRSGGQMAGAIDMSNNNISNLGDAVNDRDAVSKGFLKTIRPFAIQLITVQMDFGYSPTGNAEITIPLNPEFEQNFTNFVFLRLYNDRDVIVPSGGFVEYTVESGNFIAHRMSIEHIVESSSFKFSVIERYGDGSRMNGCTFLVIGIN